MAGSKPGTSLVVCDSAERILQSIVRDARKPLYGKARVLQFERKEGTVYISDDYGNLFGDAWFDNAHIAHQVAERLNNG